jgi:hypothetical protein
MAAAKRKAARKVPTRRKTAKRELIDTSTSKLFMRRSARGTSFMKVVDAGRSSAPSAPRPSARYPPGRATVATGGSAPKSRWRGYA